MYISIFFSFKNYSSHCCLHNSSVFSSLNIFILVFLFTFIDKFYCEDRRRQQVCTRVYVDVRVYFLCGCNELAYNPTTTKILKLSSICNNFMCLCMLQFISYTNDSLFSLSFSLQIIRKTFAPLAFGFF